MITICAPECEILLRTLYNDGYRHGSFGDHNIEEVLAIVTPHYLDRPCYATVKGKKFTTCSRSCKECVSKACGYENSNEAISFLEYIRRQRIHKLTRILHDL